MSQAPKFLLGGVNKWKNFGGLMTVVTACYGCAEVAIKAAPIFAFIYGVSKYLSKESLLSKLIKIKLIMMK